MTDAAFTNLLRRTAKAQNKARALLKKAEDEYERRYGSHPSDADDDSWIDQIQGGNGDSNELFTAEEVEKGAVGYAKLKPYINR
jgi:hypothetical protein